MFGPKSGSNKVLKLLKSLYRLRQAPRTFFEKLREGLLVHGYIQSEIDPCLFMKPGIICVCYIDDTIFAGADSELLEAEIQSLGVNKKNNVTPLHSTMKERLVPFLESKSRKQAHKNSI